MYPFKSVLIGCPNELLANLQRELNAGQIPIAFDYPDARTTQANLPASSDTKHLLIVHIQRAEQLAALEALDDHYSGWPILALLDSTLGSAALLEAQRKGASQVVLLPLQPEDFRLALGRIAKQFGSPHRASELIVVAGTSEGCGATTVAMNLAYALATRLNHETILVELALHLGRLANNLDLQPQLTTPSLFTDLDQLDYTALKQSLTRYGTNLRLLAGPYRSISNVQASPEKVRDLLSHLRTQAEVVVVDVPATFDDVYFAALSAATRLVLVTEQSVPAVQSLTIVRDAIERHDITVPQVLVLNRYDRTQQGLQAEKLEQVVHGPQFLLVPAHYESLRAAMNMGKFVEEVDASSPLVPAISRLAECVMASPQDNGGGAKKEGSPLSRFLKYLGT